MRSTRALSQLASFCICGMAGSCGPQAVPGDPLGEFRVQAQLIENECGAAAVPAFETFDFSVEIREIDGRAWWIRPERPFIEGVRTGEQLSFRTQLPVPTPVDGCVLSQVERIEVEVADDHSPDAGTAPGDNPSLTGVNRIEFSTGLNTNCFPLVAQNGGPFLSLPCELSYDLTGP